MTKRTQEEILARLKEIGPNDFFGFQSADLIEFLNFAHAKKFLKDGVTADQWKQYTDPVEQIKDYMSFAWDKANSCRGLSACRSIEHMRAWVWLDGNTELLKQIEEDYEYYGKPHLVKVCETYGIDWKALDNDKWVNSEDATPSTAKEALS